METFNIIKIKFFDVRQLLLLKKDIALKDFLGKDFIRLKNNYIYCLIIKDEKYQRYFNF